MKKFILFIFIILFSALGANAEYTVHYMAGRPVSVSNGIGPAKTIYNNTMKNMTSQTKPIRPTEKQIIPYYPRRIGYYSPYGIVRYNEPRTSNYEYEPISKLNKDYNSTNIPRNSYKMNGVTYYN